MSSCGSPNKVVSLTQWNTASPGHDNNTTAILNHFIGLQEGHLGLDWSAGHVRADACSVVLLWNTKNYNYIQGVNNYIHNYIQGVLECCFPFSPCMYVLGDPSLSPEVETAEEIQVSIMIGRLIIMKGWQSPSSPSFQEWAAELGKVAAYEEMAYRLLERKWGV